MKLLLFCFLSFSAPGFAQTPASPFHLVVLGDSITEGYGLDKSKAYPQLLQEKFDKENLNIKITNAGISGSTSSTALSRLKWFLKSKPQALILALGANDGLRGVPAATMEKNLSDTIQLAKDNKIQVILVGMMLPPNYGETYRRDFQNVFKRISQKHKVDFIPFLLKDVAGEKTLNQEDGIHPNEKGQQKIAEMMYPLLKGMLKLEKKP